MKKLITLFVAVALTLSLSACGNNDAFKGGDFQGTAKGYAEDITVTVSINDEKVITDVQVEENDTPSVGGKAIETLVAKVIENNSIDVDTVSGATMSSTGLIEALGAALESAGLSNDDLKKVDVEEAGEVVKDADVVIVGAGGAGMTAAITAAQAGKSVIIVEKAGITGGNSSRATGGMNAAKTVFQDNNEFAEDAGVEKRLSTTLETYPELEELVNTVKKQYEDYKANPTGYFDSVEMFMLDTLVGGKNINDPELVKTLVENSASAIDWLQTLSKPIVLTSVSSFGGASCKRIHRPVNEEGKTIPVGSYMIPLLEENCKDLGIEIITDTRVDEILMEDGKAVGVKGGNLTVNAKSVVLTTGGFAANLDMVTELKPELAGFITTNAATIEGDGIKMAQAVNAATVDLDQIQIHPTVHQETSALITEGLRGDGAILVNQEGKRFTDEVGTRDAVSQAELAQTGKYAYLIVDQKMVDASNVIAGYIKKGFTVEGTDVNALAEAIGCDAATLTETLSTWNGYVEAKEDKDFGRTSFANPLDTAPYYAIKVAPGVHHTMGGVKINSNAEVIDVNGAVIPGLFAAGEVTGGVHGANRLGGNAVADFVVFGRIAGTSASAFAE